MWTLDEISDPEERSQTCKAIIETLPHWFGIPDANANYIAKVAGETCLVARNGSGGIVGMLSLRLPFPNNADIYWLGVLPEYHRRGVGKVLVEGAFAKARSLGTETITVETLGPSSPDEGYARTRAFYLAMGFRPLFELEPYGPENIMLYLARTL